MHSFKLIKDENLRPVYFNYKTSIKKHSDYDLVVLNHYLDQAVRAIQHAFRQRHQGGPIHIQFKHLLEPRNLQKFIEMLQVNILNNNYHKIDYHYPEFTRALFAALRL